MRVFVFGAGAIGSLIGGLLSIESDVTLVTRAPHADAIRRNGLRIAGATELVARPAATTKVPDETPDVVFVTTKSYDTRRAVDALRGFSRRSTFITLQNGLGNAETLASHVNRVVAGTTTHGVTFVGPGEIVHAGVGDTILGPFHGLTTREVEPFARALSDAGMATAVVDDPRPRLWEKAIVNAAINPLTAVMRVPNGVLPASADLRALIRNLAREGSSAAKAAGFVLDPKALEERVLEVATRTAANRSSMLQDILASRRTENEAILGALLGAGETDDEERPYLRMLHACIQGLERAANLPEGGR